jgi:predicted nucleotide-binding protein (sugar kinase/HSP70/actin superfamily)
MDEIATISHQYYDNHLRGGEGHMEVGKLIQTVTERKAHMVISVKPFGCMPSSGVSDGVQSLVVERYPEAIFCAIETTGDGAANAQSRVMMDLFKARARAKDEYAAVLRESGVEESVVQSRHAARRALHRATYYPRASGLAGTGARLLRELC